MNITTKILPVLGLGALLTACAHESSQEMHTAQSLYSQAQSSNADSLAKADLYEAQKALDQAASLKDRKKGSKQEQDLAYVAARKAQYAMVSADLTKAERDKKAAVARRAEVLKDQRDLSQRRLAATSEELSDREKALAAKEEKLQEAQAKQAQLRHRLDDAMASLSEVAELKQDKDKMVITLNGSVLFKTDSSNLLPTAQQKLMEVASVLREYDEDYSITVEGHTDSRGSADHNATLSLHRAQAVEGFLEDQGIDDGALKAVGRGESEPVAKNSSPEGRANNRRVEIVIDKNTVAQR